MRRIIVVLLAALFVAAIASGCTGSEPRSSDPQPTPPTTAPGAATQLAPGLYDVEGGKVEALGTLDYRDVEGGFWLVTGGTQAQDDVGATVAVIANGDSLRQQLEALKGQQVRVIGTRFEGVSIRMAGPEIIAESVEAVTPTADPAQ